MNWHARWRAWESAGSIRKLIQPRLRTCYAADWSWRDPCDRTGTASGLRHPHKLYWNRITPSDRQLGDVAGVMEVQRGRLDEDYLRHWAGQLGVAPELAAALSGSLKPKET